MIIGMIACILIAVIAVAAAFIVPTLQKSDSDNETSKKTDRVDRDEDDREDDDRNEDNKVDDVENNRDDNDGNDDKDNENPEDADSSEDNNGNTDTSDTPNNTGNNDNTDNTGNTESSDPLHELAGNYDITIWVSEMSGVAQLTKAQIARFEQEHPGIKLNVTIEGVTEADAGSKVVADVYSAPDIYCFAQDQLPRLVQTGALSQLGSSASDLTRANNDAGSVAAASVAGTLYAYPMTSDNGYFMYYDKSILSESDAEDLRKIIAACEANGVKFRFALENAWYTASFFFATGCRSTWTMDDSGTFVAIDDTFYSDSGLIAMRGMQMLTQSPCYDSNADIFTDAGVVVTGIWNANAAANHFGANMGVTDLPSFSVDGMTYHLGSFTGNKLMGVKPQSDAKRAAVLHLLAQYLTNETCQMERFYQFQWGPSNRAAQASDAVQANASLAALVKQSAYGVPQGQIHGAWWDIAKVLGSDARRATSISDLENALIRYNSAINSLFGMTDEQKNAWGVIGAICGTCWDTDFPMTKEGENTWISDVLYLRAGEEFKVRRGASWDMNFGVEYNGANVVVEKDGQYRVRLDWYGDFDGTVTLVPVG